MKLVNESIAIQLIKPRQVWMARFPYEDDPTQSKVRPVLVMAGDDESERVSVLSMKITSTEPRDKYDFVLDDWALIPIDHQSTICPAHVTALPLSNFKELRGIVSDSDWERATDRFERFLHDIGVI